MKKLKAIALSDLHLGEPEGLLYHKDDFNIIDTLVQKMENLSRGNDSFENGVEELILVGDIVDLSEAEDDEAYENTRVVLKAITERVNIDKIIYIPGNHDHHLWVELLKSEQDEDDFDNCSPKIMVDTSLKKMDLFISNCLPGYSQEKLDIRYPQYKIETKDSFFLFDHGHLFSKTIEKLTNATEAERLNELEDLTYNFMEAIWYNTKSKPREVFYDWMRKFNLEFRNSVNGTTFLEDCTPILDDYIRSKIKWYLRDICGIENQVGKDFHFIFGHTHNGGRIIKADRKIRLNGLFISIWNTGGWLVPSKIYSPDAYIFYIENSKEGLQPNMCKLVSREKPEEEGDYHKRILRKRALHIG